MLAWLPGMLSSALQLYVAKCKLMWGDMHLMTEVNSAGERFHQSYGRFT